MTYDRFGLWESEPPNLDLAWGCRGIFKDGEIDIVPTNTSWDGKNNTPKERRKFVTHINESLQKFRPIIRRKWRKGELTYRYNPHDKADPVIHVLRYKNVTCHYRARGGYIYMLFVRES